MTAEDLRTAALAFVAAMPDTRDATRWQRAHAITSAAEPLFHAAIELAFAQPTQLAPDEEQAIAAILDPALAGYVSGDLFAYAGLELGYWYGGASWATCCLVASGSAALRRLLPSLTADLEMDVLVDEMERWGSELFADTNPPDGIPADHWWWWHAGKE